ncbi:MAG: imidazoleglycerol-phosphate dehydratase HisB [Candidatus Firestonebacteria bacterium]|nr:imidazoleglycerol-phosphate dehydratase HisB [Candidatus Firestonebacteria bacterium]
MALTQRRARVARKTKETQISAAWNLDGSGKVRLSLGLPFLEHMLTLFAAHGLFDLEIRAQGDLDVDQHHLVEDLGLTLGQTLQRALGSKQGIVRYGACQLPMDETLVETVVDVSGRPYLAYGLKLRQRRLAEFDTELVVEFLRALVQAGGLTLHVTQKAGGNTHHVVEALFKGLGRALRAAVTRDARVRGIPSTKGVL